VADNSPTLWDSISTSIGDNIDSALAYFGENWTAAVAQWDNVTAQFWDALNQHAALYEKAASLGPTELARWQQLTDRAQMVIDTITATQEQLKSAVSFFKQTVGLDGLRGSLKSLQIVPAVAITAAIAIVVAITASLITYRSQLNDKWDYINKHPELTPEQVNAVLENSGGGSSVVSSFTSLAVWIAIAGVVIVFGPTLMKQLTKKE
jgi:hypothetical protein